MNNDYLRVNSKIEDKDIVVSELKNEKPTATENREKPVNLITLLNFSRNNQSNSESTTQNLPDMHGVFTFLIICARAVIIFTLASFLSYEPTLLLHR